MYTFFNILNYEETSYEFCHTKITFFYLVIVVNVSKARKISSKKCIKSIKSDSFQIKELIFHHSQPFKQKKIGLVKYYENKFQLMNQRSLIIPISSAQYYKIHKEQSHPTD